MSRRTILSVSYPLATVGPASVGGAEQILTRLDRAIVQAGWRSLVVAPEGSRVQGELLPIPRECGRLDEAARSRAHTAARLGVERALNQCSVDLVHMHGLDFHAYAPDAGPTLVSLHLPFGFYAPGVLRSARPDLWFHAVSQAQHRARPQDLSLLDPIENGVDCDAFRFRSKRMGYALVLARICPEKGVHHALDAARRANIDLLIGGEVHRYSEHEAYWREEIAPRLDRRRRFLGPLDFARKRRLLSAARCVLIPSLAAETSSLVAMEAMASGAPVIAFASGALSDLIEPGRTGFLVRSMEEMAEAIARVHEIDAMACRSIARARFSADRMASRYLELYGRLASRRASAA